MKKLISTICLALSISSPAIAQYVADYDPVGNTLALPWVKIGDSYYSNVVLSVPPGEPWSLLRSGAQMGNVPASSAVFDPATSLLSIPSVSIHSATSTRSLTRASVRATAVDDSQTLVAGVDVSLADGNWAVTRAGTSVRITSSRDIDPIDGTITDRFPVTCKTSGGTLTCTNVGFLVGDTFGLDTDGDGDQDQVWKVTSEACLAVQAAPHDNNPPDADTFLGDDTAEVGSVEAFIYAHPDGPYIMRYGDGPDWLSCAVHPVSGVSYVVQNPTGDLSVSNTAIAGEVGDVLSFVILGGTPPYNVISENAALASVSFGSASGNLGQTVNVTLNSAGQSSTSTSASTNLFVYDWYQQTATIAVSITKSEEDESSGGVTASALSFTPSSVTDFSVGAVFRVWLTGGTPPYRVFNPLPDYVEVDKLSSDTYEVYLARMPYGATELTGGLLFYDSGSPAAQSGWLPIDFTATSVQYNGYQ